MTRFGNLDFPVLVTFLGDRSDQLEEYFSKLKEVFHKNGLLFNNLSQFPKIYFDL
jgi:hypothetical protein